MKKLLLLIMVIVLLLVLWFIFSPSHIDAVAWTPPTDLGFTGDLKTNEKMQNVTFLNDKECAGCEDVAINHNGNYLYGGSINGDILRFDLTTGQPKTLANTGGRPLGLHFDLTGNLIIADAKIGLLKMDLSDYKITTYVDSYQGKKMGFVDDLDIDSSGVIYFSDASDKFGYESVIEDLMEHRPHGALYSYNPSTDETKLLVDDLYFANGVALAEDESFVLFNETGLYSISKYWLKGPNKGTREFINNNLPGYPDGVSRGDNGVYWLTIISPRVRSTDDLMSTPGLRNMIMKLPKALHPAAQHYNCIIGMNENGKIIHNLQSSNPKYSEIASVQQYGDRLYFGSLNDIGVVYYEL